MADPSATIADGALVIDKPEGPTSHDVVGRVRRVLHERRVGHAGTLDPLASGVVVVLVGRATRLSPYLTSDEKRYRATIRLGVATTTYDREGDPLAPPSAVPADADARLAAALDARLGTHPQAPPAFSAKKVGGERAHRLARRGEAVAPAPVAVTLRAWRLVSRDGDLATIDLETSAGFYVRSLAHDVGTAMGCGAHLAALRRTASGRFGLDAAVPLPDVDAPADALLRAVRPMAGLLDAWPAAVVTGAGQVLIGHGAAIGPDVCTTWPGNRPVEAGPAAADRPSVRIMDADGRLLALAAWRGPLLHPSVVLV